MICQADPHGQPVFLCPQGLPTQPKWQNTVIIVLKEPPHAAVRQFIAGSLGRPRLSRTPLFRRGCRYDSHAANGVDQNRKYAVGELLILAPQPLPCILVTAPVRTCIAVWASPKRVWIQPQTGERIDVKKNGPVAPARTR